jgi:hypothetical protein
VVKIELKKDAIKGVIKILEKVVIKKEDSKNIIRVVNN